ncbi:MAG TPA: DNA methyltransferase [Fibrobacteraceae bacterium]|nr:DNA methyltransferase [Fibrobacteraceae bacterium]
MNSLEVLRDQLLGRVEMIFVDAYPWLRNKDRQKDLLHLGECLWDLHDLLRSDGVLFLCAEESVQAALKTICDEIFGNFRYAGTLCWLKKKRPSFLSRGIIPMIEFVHAYGKNQPVILHAGTPRRVGAQPLLKASNPVRTLLFPGKLVHIDLEDGAYSPEYFKVRRGRPTLLEPIQVQQQLIQNPFRLRGNFVWTQPFLQRALKETIRIYLHPRTLSPRVIRNPAEESCGVPSFLDGRTFQATYEDARRQIREILGQESFPASKPEALIRYLMRIGTSKGALILAPQASLGEVLHATLALNAEDDGQRQCLLFEEDPRRIDWTKKRVQRLIHGYSDAQGKWFPGWPQNEFKVCRIESAGH